MGLKLTLFFFWFACRMARGHEETSTSQARRKRGIPRETPTVSVTSQNLGVPLTTRQHAEYLWVSHISIPPYHIPFTGIHSCIYCDAPKPGGPLTTRQPAEYEWTSGYPTSLQKIGQSLLCTGSSTQLQNLHITCPKQSNICNIYQLYPICIPTMIQLYIFHSYKSYNIFTLK